MIISPSLITSIASMVAFIFSEKWCIIPASITLAHHISALGVHARHFQSHPSTSHERFGNLPPRLTSTRHLYILLCIILGWVGNFLALAYIAASASGAKKADTANVVLYIVALGLTALEASLSTGLLAVLVCARHRGSRPLFPPRPDTELATLPVTNSSSLASRLQSISNLPPARASTGSLGFVAFLPSPFLNVSLTAILVHRRPPTQPLIAHSSASPFKSFLLCITHSLVHAFFLLHSLCSTPFVMSFRTIYGSEPIGNVSVKGRSTG